MKINADVVVMDYDRTVASESLGFMISDQVLEALSRSECKLILATGRRFQSIPDRRVRDVFHVILTENGTIFNSGSGDVKRILVEEAWFPKKEKISEVLKEAGIAYHSGEAILAAHRRDLGAVQIALEETGLRKEVSLEFNREGLMVLPAGWGKGRGTLLALRELGGGRLLAMGDDFNDLSLFDVADVRVAVKNAVPELKMRADVICEEENGMGVAEILGSIWRGE